MNGQFTHKGLNTRIAEALGVDPRVEAWKTIYDDDADGGCGALRYVVGLTDGHAHRFSPGECADWLGLDR